MLNEGLAVKQQQQKIIYLQHFSFFNNFSAIKPVFFAFLQKSLHFLYTVKKFINFYLYFFLLVRDSSKISLLKLVDRCICNTQCTLSLERSKVL